MKEASRVRREPSSWSFSELQEHTLRLCLSVCLIGSLFLPACVTTPPFLPALFNPSSAAGASRWEGVVVFRKNSLLGSISPGCVSVATFLLRHTVTTHVFLTRPYTPCTSDAADPSHSIKLTCVAASQPVCATVCRLLSFSISLSATVFITSFLSRSIHLASRAVYSFPLPSLTSTPSSASPLLQR